jgi:multidrug efflux pump subunit AcrB
MLAAVGYSLNSLSLFGLVLAIGIVVDDAIVVVENVERNIEHGMSPLEAARTSMDEVAAALVAIVLVLCAVFVPTLFITGISGAFYQQFAVTIYRDGDLAAAVADPVAGRRRALLRPKHRSAADDPTAPRWKRVLAQAGDRFNTGFDRLSDRYGRLTRWLLARRKKVPRPMPRDRRHDRPVLGDARRVHSGAGSGYLLAVVQLPPGLAGAHRRGDREVAAKILPIKACAAR